MSEKLDIRKMSVNPENPRTMSEFMEGKLIESILVFPRMLELRPIIVNGQNVVLGGNMRLAMLKKILDMEDDEIEDYMFNQKKYRLMDAGEQKKLHDFWKKFKKKPEVSVRVAENLSESEEREFLVKDNMHYGEDDVNILKKNFDKDIIEDITGSVPWNLYDYDDKMNFEEKDVKALKLERFSCGYVEVVVTNEEAKILQERLDAYMASHESSDGFLGHILGMNK